MYFKRSAVEGRWRHQEGSGGTGVDFGRHEWTEVAHRPARVAHGIPGTRTSTFKPGAKQTCEESLSEGL